MFSHRTHRRVNLKHSAITQLQCTSTAQCAKATRNFCCSSRQLCCLCKRLICISSVCDTVWPGCRDQPGLPASRTRSDQHEDGGFDHINTWQQTACVAMLSRVRLQSMSLACNYRVPCQYDLVMSITPCVLRSAGQHCLQERRCHSIAPMLHGTNEVRSCSRSYTVRGLLCWTHTMLKVRDLQTAAGRSSALSERS